MTDWLTSELGISFEYHILVMVLVGWSADWPFGFWYCTLYTV